MIKLLNLILIFLFLSNCSFNKNSKIWNKKEIQVDNKKNIKKIIDEKKIIISELNPNLELNFSAVSYDNIIKEYNNFGFQSFLVNFYLTISVLQCFSLNNCVYFLLICDNLINPINLIILLMLFSIISPYVLR